MSRFKELQAKLDGDGLTHDELAIYSALLRNHYAEKCRQVNRLLGDIQVLKLQLAAKRWTDGQPETQTHD